MCMHITSINEKKVLHFLKKAKGYIGGFGVRKRKEEIIQLCYNLKKKGDKWPSITPLVIGVQVLYLLILKNGCHTPQEGES